MVNIQLGFRADSLCGVSALTDYFSHFSVTGGIDFVLEMQSGTDRLGSAFSSMETYLGRYVVSSNPSLRLVLPLTSDDLGKPCSFSSLVDSLY
jgi:hypothetical protein